MTFGKARLEQLGPQLEGQRTVPARVRWGRRNHHPVETSPLGERKPLTAVAASSRGALIARPSIISGTLYLCVMAVMD